MDAHALGRFTARLIRSWLFSLAVALLPAAALALELHVVVEHGSPDSPAWKDEGLAWLTRLAPEGSKLYFYSAGAKLSQTNLTPLANNTDDSAPPASELPNMSVAQLLAMISQRTQAKGAQIILLTDTSESGLISGKWLTERPEYVSALQASETRLHIIALGSSEPTFEAIAAMTNGVALAVANVAEGERKFARLVQQLGPRATVPIVDSLFRIDRSVENTSLLLFRPDPNLPAEFISPALGSFSQFNRPDNVVWHSSDNFEIVHFSKPLTGTWHVGTSDDPANRVFINSPLVLGAAAIEQQFLPRHELPLLLQLRQDGQPVTSAEVLDHLVIKATHSTGSGASRTWFPEDAGKGWDAQAGDGIYTLALSDTDHAGWHEVVVDAETVDAQRRAYFAFNVVDTPVYVARRSTNDAIEVLMYARHGLIDPQTIVVSQINGDENADAALMHPDPYIWKTTIALDAARQMELNVSATHFSGNTVSIWMPVIEDHVPLAQSRHADHHALHQAEPAAAQSAPASDPQVDQPAPHQDETVAAHSVPASDPQVDQAAPHQDEPVAAHSAPAPDPQQTATTQQHDEHHASVTPPPKPAPTAGTRAPAQVPTWRTASDMLAVNMLIALGAVAAVRYTRKRRKDWLTSIEGELAHDPA